MKIDYARYNKLVDEAAKHIEEKVSIRPKALVVLTGGMGSFAAAIKNSTRVEFGKIPHFVTAQAEGHAGAFVFGTMNGLPIAAMKGRFHYYEGHHLSEVVFPYFVLHRLGMEILINTNAVGGIRNDLNPGDIMLVTDHINMMGNNPLIGLAVQRKTDQFTNMIDTYDRELAEVVRRSAASANVQLKEGIYAAVSGPCYETRAEVRALRTLGADAVGMSTLPEVIVARFLDVRVLALSVIANPAADRHGGEMSHDEVLQAMNESAPRVVSLLKRVVEEVARG